TVAGEFPFWPAAKAGAPPGGFGSAFADTAVATDIAKSLSGITAAESETAEAAARWTGYGVDATDTVFGILTALDIIEIEVPGLDAVAVALEVAQAIAAVVI